MRLTWYVTDRNEYLNELPAVGAAYREVIGRNYPAMAVMAVTALMEAQAKVEIEATAMGADMTTSRTFRAGRSVAVRIFRRLRTIVAHADGRPPRPRRTR